MLQSKLKYVILLSSICLLGCNDAAECIINRRPDLPSKSFIGFTGMPFSNTIKGEIKNETKDDLYNYDFSVSGDLPVGLSTSSQHRTLTIEGSPKASGRYSFTVHLSAKQNDDYDSDCKKKRNNCKALCDDCDGLCKDSTKETYSIVIK